MKTNISKAALMVALAITISAAAEAQLRIEIRPSVQVQTRPVRPSNRHVWVTAEYNSNGNRYDRRDGYWAEPPQNRRRYSEGHWVRNRHGYVWVPGRWRR